MTPEPKDPTEELLTELLKQFDRIDLQLRTTNDLLNKISSRLIAQNIIHWLHIIALIVGPILITLAFGSAILNLLSRLAR
jgi:hypothetical protein